ncbi:MFS transporter [Burkholderia ubonensis]|uniref:MFS transporter n=1 Tax=Burkholderia ubonensis TaxID=101571 RepID=UPI000BA60ACE|nr:MFS transporter [Burkholderia ubonensis]PAJ86390.1 hypothetical protein CJO70_17485 [Burkholderia ubonensis]PAJ93390.1 hypothetical protein CJO69_17055 [Burkholderia ubonensis]PAK06395.1 hypothetical protein CJO67_18700 [Burkholderia ubonensis]PAK12169.1 hypothetical protein CJO66_23975 [Burkholderia ubonensis]RQP31436.1 MFS transporter [Burkholderia ubonensis]
MNQATSSLTVRTFLKELSPEARFLFFGAFLNQLGYVIQGYLIAYMHMNSFSLDQAGLGLGLFSAASICGTFIGSTLSERLGYGKTIALASFGLAMTVLLIPRAVISSEPAWVWMGALVLCGLFAQMSRPASGVVLSEHVPSQYRVMGFSMFRVALNVGGALSPLLATALIPHGWYYVFGLSAICSAGYGLIAWLKLSGGTIPTSDSPSPQQVAPASWLSIVADGKFVSFLMAMFLSSVVFTQFTSTVPAAIESKGLPLESYSSLLTIYAIVLVVLELKISAVVSKFSDWIPATVGTTLICLAVTAIGYSIGNDWLMKISSAFVVLGVMISGPTMFAYPAKFPVAIRSRCIAATQSAFFAGMTVGPVVGLYMFRNFGSTVWLGCLMLAVISGGLVVVGIKHDGHIATTKDQNHVESVS